MKAYFVATREPLSPFGEHPRDCLIMDRPLHEWQRDALVQAGHTPAGTAPTDDPEEHLLVEDRLLFSADLLKEFVRSAKALRAPAWCGVKSGLSTLRTVSSTQDLPVEKGLLRFGITYVPPLAMRTRAEAPVAIDLDEHQEPFPMPSHMFGESQFLLPITTKVLVRIHHWTNLWAAHLLLLFGRGAALRKASPGRKIWLVLKARSFNKWSVLRQTNRIGRDCDIHPTAYVEGCTIGDGCTIGAGAVIRLSHIGAGSQIANNTTIVGSSLGAGSAVLNGSSLQFAVAWSGLCSTSPRISCSILGRDCFMGGGTTLTDFRLDSEKMSVFHNGRLINTRNECIGSCLGHNVYMGSGTIVAPGREIPNGYRIATHEQRILRSVRGLESGQEGFRVVARHGAVAEPGQRVAWNVPERSSRESADW